MPRTKKIAIILAGLVLFYALAGFLVIPLVAEKMLPDKLSAALNRSVSVENIRLNPFTLTAAVEGFKILDKNSTDPFVGFDELLVNVQTMSLFKLGLVVKEVRLTKPDIHIIRLSETGFNFSDLIPEKSPEQKNPEPEPETEGRSFRFSISNIAIIDGNIAIQDNTVQKHHALSKINLTLPRISNFDSHIDSYSEPLLTADLNQADVSIDVDTKPFHGTMETIVNLSAINIEIPHYFAYVPENMVGSKIKDGQLDLDARISFIQNGDAPELVVQGNIRLAGLEIIENNNSELLTLPELKIAIAPSAPLNNQLTLASVEVHAPELSVTRSSDGIINLTTLVPKPAETNEGMEQPEAPAPAESIDQSGSEETVPENPFIFSIDNLLLDGGRVLFTDHVAAKNPDAAPVKMSVDDLVIRVSDFTTAPDKNASFDVNARINDKASVSVTGRAGISPLQAETDFDLSDVNLGWGQPYIPDNIQLVITDGKLATSGHAAVETLPDGNIRTTVTAKAAVTEFDSMEKTDREPFVSWNTFSVDGIDVSLNPLKIHTDKILLKDFKNQVIIDKDGAANLSKIFIHSEPEEPAGQTPAAPERETDQEKAPEAAVPVSIGEVLLDNFNFQFIDHSIEPDFETRLNLSKLTVTGLTSEDFKAADLKGQGSIDEYAPIKIEGSLNPLKEDMFLDLNWSLSNMELSPLSPYTGKYIGRTIEKGKLSTDINYKIENKEISAQNHLILDQFTLGRQVDSPDDLNLPVSVAIALLKDRNGEINVDLPISGRTDDPSFGIAKPLLKALQNLIVKAATSPFALVGSIVGGGEELRYIEFAPASAVITDKETEKLDTIKKLMYERPALKLDISGYIDMEADRDALTDLTLARKIKTLSLGKDSPKDIEALDKIELPPEEYEKLIKQVYEEEVLTDPEMQQTAKPLKDPALTIGEMENLIRQKIIVTDDELRLLALERARSVKGYLLQEEGVSADRLFLAEPESLSPEKKENFSASRVELNVR